MRVTGKEMLVQFLSVCDAQVDQTAFQDQEMRLDLSHSWQQLQEATTKNQSQGTLTRNVGCLTTALKACASIHCSHSASAHVSGHWTLSPSLQALHLLLRVKLKLVLEDMFLKHTELVPFGESRLLASSYVYPLSTSQFLKLLFFKFLHLESHPEKRERGNFLPLVHSP